MLDGTYPGLVTSVGEFLNRGDLTSAVPDFIRMFEANANRRLRCADMVTSATLAVSTSSTALPVDFNGIVSFELPAGTGTPLRYVRPEEARALKQEQYTATGTPKMFTIIGMTIETVPAPSQLFNCALAYFARLPAATPSGNWLLTKHPDIYLYGSLLESAPYLKDDERVSVWGALLEKALGDLESSDARTAYGHGLLAAHRGATTTAGPIPR